MEDPWKRKKKRQIKIKQSLQHTPPCCLHPNFNRSCLSCLPRDAGCIKNTEGVARSNMRTGCSAGSNTHKNTTVIHLFVLCVPLMWLYVHNVSYSGYVVRRPVEFNSLHCTGKGTQYLQTQLRTHTQKNLCYKVRAHCGQNVWCIAVNKTQRLRTLQDKL